MEDSYQPTPPQSDSSTDAMRVEMLWGHKQELQVVKWREEGLEKVLEHKKKYGKMKCFHLIMTVPTIILPIIASSMSELLSTNQMAVIMVLTGVLTGLNSFLNFSKKQEAHAQFEMQWTVFAAAISTEMCKPKKHRIQCDVFLQKVLGDYQRLLHLEPS